MNVETMHTFARDDRALITRGLASGARRIVEVAADTTSVVVGSGDGTIPSPSVDEMNTFNFGVHYFLIFFFFFSDLKFVKSNNELMMMIEALVLCGNGSKTET